MKASTKKYWLGFSILACLAIGASISKPVMSWLNPGVTYLSRTIHGSYIGRNISTYTQEAAAIIIGEVKEVGKPYVRPDRGYTSQQDIHIDVKEVMKGDPTLKTLKILIEGGHAVAQSKNGDIHFISEEEELFKPGEKILLFVGKTSWNDYVAFAGPYGKYLIDQNNNVKGVGGFQMPLEKLKSQIQEALKLPYKERVPTPVEKMI